MESLSLYGIAVEYKELLELIMSEEGEVSEATAAALIINRGELQKKAEGYVSIINKLSSESDYIDSEVKRLQAAKKVRENAVERLKNALAGAMTLYDITEIKTHLNKISFRKSESVIIDVEPEELPPMLQKIKIEAISKLEIKALIKAGNIFKGVRLIDNKSLQIK